MVNVAGIWEYNFTTALKTQLAKLIEGKSRSAAQGILAAQTGVSKVVSITLSSGTTLPTESDTDHYCGARCDRVIGDANCYGIADDYHADGRAWDGATGYWLEGVWNTENGFRFERW